MSRPRQCKAAAALLGLACAACLFAAKGATVSAYSDPRNSVCPTADWRVRDHPSRGGKVARSLTQRIQMECIGYASFALSNTQASPR